MLRDALTVMQDKSLPFQIKFVTLDVKRKTGGEILELTNAVKVGSKRVDMKANDLINIKQLGNTNHPHYVHVHLITEFNHQTISI